MNSDDFEQMIDERLLIFEHRINSDIDKFKSEMLSQFDRLKELLMRIENDSHEITREI